jgi:hypothetical protein
MVATVEQRLEHPAQAEEEAMVSGVADGAADQNRAEDGIHDEPGSPVAGIAVFSWLADWSIESLVDSALESDDDLMSAMARELVERGHVGESADAVWADLKRERDLHLASMPAHPSQDTVAVTEERLAEMPLFLPQPEPPDLTLVQSAVKPKQKHSPLWPTGHGEGKQLLLFA